MLRITAAVQNYDWGSTSAIPAFIGAAPSAQPVAELWFGTHPIGTSLVNGTEGDRPLSDVVQNLPFMLKVLAPAQPLSIQVHPAPEIAQAGFDAEESAGVDLTDSARDYKDPFHKPEMVYALTPFETLVGLRPVAEVVELLTPLNVSLSRSMLSKAGGGTRAVLESLLSQPPHPEDVRAFASACATRLEAGIDIRRAYVTVTEAAVAHPGDAGVAVALLLNRLTIGPGTAAFIGSGLIHAHLSGLCLEVMTPSDNVFRAGLTSKRVNAQGFMDSLDADNAADPRVAARPQGASTRVYEPHGGLFALSVTAGPEGRLPGTGERVLLCLEGEVEIKAADGATLALAKGQAAFAGTDDGELAVFGSGTLAQAYIP